MATIRDIAKLAGVSHGTASNVLNGRGNVSMKKILLVEEAARQLGYSLDERGRMLKQEFDRSIAIVLPTLQMDRYAILYAAASAYLQEHDYACTLYLTGDVPAQEESALNDIASHRSQGVLLVACQPEGSDARALLARSGTRIVCVERETDGMEAFVGFDIALLAQSAIDLIEKEPIQRLTLIGGLSGHRNEAAFAAAIASHGEKMGWQLHQLQTDASAALITAFTAVSAAPSPDVILTTSLEYARQVVSALEFRGVKDKPRVITLAASSLLPAGDGLLRIGMNWKRAALNACRMLLKEASLACQRLCPDPPLPRPVYAKAAVSPTELNILMMDEPATYALQNLLPDFTRATGIHARFAVFPYADLFHVIDQMGPNHPYDVIRMDIMWLSSFAHRGLAPFDPEDLEIKSILAPMLTTLREACSPVQGAVCAFPFTPSVQLQFYRRDLFEDGKVKRQFYEATHQLLEVPKDYDSLETLLRFFSAAENPRSPIEYGSSIVTGSPIAVACEFLPILSAMGGQLFDDDGNPNVFSEAGVRALTHYLALNRYGCNVSAGALWKGAVENFAKGSTAMLNVFTNHARNIVDLRKSKIAGRIGYATVPGQNPLLGGGVLGIAASSQRQTAALEFIRWACSEQIGVPLTLLGGTSPCRSVYTNEHLLELYPWLSVIPDNFRLAVQRRAPQPLDDYTAETMLGRAIKNVLSGFVGPEEGLKGLQAELTALLVKNQ
ncbi:MAG: extracellular solute-binding protein [Eubacteriales bacterium]|nr:extracellular solute-binding protein [Eubacteriales bacterium]